MNRLQKNFQKLEIDTKVKHKADSNSPKNKKPKLYSPVDISPSVSPVPSCNGDDSSTKHCQPSCEEHKKRWYQIPRMSLKRQASTPLTQYRPNQITSGSGLGGLKAGTVEPPSPPPQLLLDLNWSTDQDIVVGIHQSYSTPASPILNRRISSDLIQPDLIQEKLGNVSKHKKSSSLSSMDQELSFSFTELTKLPAHQTTYETSFTEKTSSSKSPFSSHSLKPKRPKSTTLSSDQQHTNKPLHSSNSSSTSNENYLLSVYTKDTHQLVLNFTSIRPRSVQLKRKINPKIETKAIIEWQNQLMSCINQNLFPPRTISSCEIPEAKKPKYSTTRKFIIEELYSTEINYWNQLNYTKVMFCDPLRLALSRHSAVAKPSDMDWFANLNDLMLLSSNLTLKFKNQSEDTHIGSIFRSLAEHMIVFLRCALDYKANKKLMDHKKKEKGYNLYLEKLSLKKETRHFTFEDYLIIPIQRITRYGLLLADLERHTEPMHPDSENIRIARYIIHSLASAMNYAQK